MSDRKVVLLTCAGGAGGTTAARLLEPLAQQIRIIGADQDAFSAIAALADDFIQISGHVGTADYCRGILSAVELFGVHAVVPCRSGEIRAFDRITADLEDRGVRWPKPLTGTWSVHDDKAELYASLLDAGLPVPSFRLVGASPPVRFENEILKPRRGAGGRGVASISGEEALPTHVLTSPDDYLLQERVEGVEISLDGVVLSDGRVLGPTARERLSVKHGLAVASRSVARRDEFDELFRTTARVAGTSGALNVQLFVNGASIAGITDVNPRFPAGGLPLAAHLGLNIPVAVVSDLLWGPDSVEEPVITDTPALHYRYWSDVIEDA